LKKKPGTPNAKDPQPQRSRCTVYVTVEWPRTRLHPHTDPHLPLVGVIGGTVSAGIAVERTDRAGEEGVHLS
jgi:hypothetical protein